MSDYRTNEQMLTAILESIGEGILAVGRSGEVIMANHKFAELWKIPEDILASNDDNRLLEFVLDQLVDPKSFLAKVKKLYLSADDDFDTIRFKDGRAFERYSRPLLDENRIVGRIWRFKDITSAVRAEQALAQSQQKYRKLFHRSRDAIIVHNMQGQVIDVNEKALQLFGYSRSEFLGMNVKQLHSEGSLDKSREAFSAVQRDGMVDFQIEFSKKTGDKFSGSVSASQFEVHGEVLVQALVNPLDGNSSGQASEI